MAKPGTVTIAITAAQRAAFKKLAALLSGQADHPLTYGEAIVEAEKIIRGTLIRENESVGAS